MFTGIVEHLGTVVSVTDGERGRDIVIDAGSLGAAVAIGDSVAVNGTCLTVVGREASQIGFQVVGETLDRTTIGTLAPQDPVNLERPMAANGRFDGHIVQGHIDGVATVRRVVPDGSGARLCIEVPGRLRRYIVEKGSVTLDGVSLTVASLTDDELEVALIPHTMEVTTLGIRRAGDHVNVEVDVLAKYVERLLGASL